MLDYAFGVCSRTFQPEISTYKGITGDVEVHQFSKSGGSDFCFSYVFFFFSYAGIRGFRWAE